MAVINPDEKLAGLLIPVFALRREGDLGIGDTKCMIDAIDFVSRNNSTVLQTLPINETGGDNSPYNAISSMSLEPCLLEMSPEAVPGLMQSDIEECGDGGCDVTGGGVDYARVRRLKMGLLRRAFGRFDSQEDAVFKRFVDDNDEWLKPYSVFRALVERHSGDSRWTQWDEPLRTYRGALEWIENSADKHELENSCLFWKFVQWVCDSQWLAVRRHADRKGVRLMGDIPFGVSRYSADVWHRQELFDLEWSGGAPPEPVFAADEFTRKWGQNWGIPIYQWKAHEQESYHWWRQRIKRLLRHFHDFRIDHVLGFFRVYSFPWLPEQNNDFVDLDEKEASDLTGGRLPGFLPRSDENREDASRNRKEGRAILEHLCRAAADGYVVAEDLGLLIPDYLRETLHDLSMAGFAIPIFERVEETYEFKHMSSLHPMSLATYATHDHQPIAVYYRELVKRWLGPNGHEGWLEVQRLMRLLSLDPDDPPRQYTGELHEAFLSAILRTDCWLVVMMITDLIASDKRFNQPGTSGRGCWTERLDQTLGELEVDGTTGPLIRLWRDEVARTGRRGIQTALR